MCFCSRRSSEGTKNTEELTLKTETKESVVVADQKVTQEESSTAVTSDVKVEPVAESEIQDIPVLEQPSESKEDTKVKVEDEPPGSEPLTSAPLKKTSSHLKTSLSRSRASSTSASESSPRRRYCRDNLRSPPAATCGGAAHSVKRSLSTSRSRIDSAGAHRRSRTGPSGFGHGYERQHPRALQSRGPRTYSGSRRRNSTDRSPRSAASPARSRSRTDDRSAKKAVAIVPPRKRSPVEYVSFSTVLANL